MLTSHPLAAEPSQFSHPESQVNPQVPFAQLDVEWGRVGQALPHAPQCVTAVSVLVSQPFDSLASQSPHPLLQLSTWQVLVVHTAEAFENEHGLAQNPQWSTLVVVSVSQPATAGSQSPNPTAQFETSQTPSTHTGVPPRDGHEFPQVLQLVGSAFRLASHPLLGSPSQSAKPVSQAPSTHCPAAQLADALANEQLRPQAPQFMRSELMSNSQPLSVVVSQLPHPGLHESIEHVPARHLVLA